MRLSMRAHLIALAALALASYAIFLGAFFAMRLVEAKDLSAKESARAAQTVSSRIQSEHQRTLGALLSLAGSLDAQKFARGEAGGGECDMWARAGMSGVGIGKAHNLLLIRKSGEIACSARLASFGKEAAAALKEPLEAASAGKSAISGVWGLSQGGLYGFAAPVRVEGEPISGMLLLVAETRGLAEMTRGLDAPNGLSLAILDKDRRHLFDLAWGERSEKNMKAVESGAKFKATSAFSSSAVSPGGDFLSFSTLPSAGWVVVSDLPKQSIYQEEEQSVAMRAAMALLFAALLFGIFFRVSSRLSEAALTLTRAAERGGARGDEKKIRTGVAEIDDSMERLEQARKHRDRVDRERILWKEAALGGSSGLAIAKLGKDGAEIEFCNGAFLKMVGLGDESCAGLSLSSLPNSSCLAESATEAALLQAMRSGGSMEREASGIDATGRKVRVSVGVEPIWIGAKGEKDRKEGKPAAYCSIHLDDVTDIIEREEAMARQSSTDALTGLPNRALFADRLDQAIQMAKAKKGRVAIACVNLNRFKLINDTLGHAYGDELLIHVAKRLSFQLSAGETLSRLGSDEFGLLMGSGEDSRESISEKLEALLVNFKDPFFAKGKEIVVTASIGVAAYPEDGESAADLLQRADIAMVQAKGESGGSVRFFSGAMGAEFQERHHMEQALLSAIKRKEIEIMLQPKASLHNGKPAGAESLARWSSAEMGMVPPWKFIPLAEESGMMIALGRVVMEKSLDAAKSLHEEGLECPVAVNVSAKQILPGFIDDIREMMADRGLPASALHVEITESSILPNSETMMEFLGGLKELGVKVALDDFGTGWSNLSLLKKLPLSYLKMDRSFVIGIGKAREDDALAQSIVGMANALGIKVIAEGVETLDQAQRLRDMGAHDIQGYLTGKPQSLEDLKGWLRAGAPLTEKG